MQLPLEPAASARAAGLRYVSNTDPGIRRRRVGEGFRYVRANGRAVADKATLVRIRSLAIPPAWTEVWICADDDGHLQATGHDARGRKQYRYHPRWREVRDETKYGRMLAFGSVLPRIRRRVSRDLARPGLPREKVLATVVRLLEKTFIRVGNEEYARENESFGLTTLRERQVKVNGSQLRFRFRGKSGVQHEVEVTDPRIAAIVRRMQDLPGEELFQYVDENGEVRAIGSSDVNAYLKEIAGEVLIPLFKDVPLQGSARLQLRMEVYNVTNTPSFGNPNGQLGNAAFGTITNTLGTPRQMQFAVKLLF